jgi:phosphate transport system permease protein
MNLNWRRKSINVVMLSLTGLCTVIVTGSLFVILGFLAWNGISSLNWDFFTKLPTPVGEAGGGMANAILGSAKVLLVAVMVGVPFGFLGGVYLAEFGQGYFPGVVRYTTDLLNGVPSIVVGIFAYAVMVRRFGFSTLAGGFALGIMMIPIALRTTEEFLRAVPLSLREAAMALGAGKARTIATVVIPAARSGLLSGLMLNLARGGGGGAPPGLWGEGWLQPTATLPVMIYTYAVSAFDDWRRQAWAAGFVLLMLVLAINAVARLVVGRVAAQAK